MIENLLELSAFLDFSLEKVADYNRTDELSDILSWLACLFGWKLLHIKKMWPIHDSSKYFSKYYMC